jgi:hypothetical protein
MRSQELLIVSVTGNFASGEVVMIQSKALVQSWPYARDSRVGWTIACDISGHWLDDVW